MEIYLVGGAVRDFLLAEIKGEFHSIVDKKNFWKSVEKDWVVVGSTPEEMISLGYRQVGKSFPVFLHPKTQEETALARTERKIGKGYTNFECYAKPDVTLEEDLMRRDLTINAIAMEVLNPDFSEYKILDPYHGEQDLKQGIFRHISAAFAEDPVRILRVARFASRLGNFQVANETEQLMKQMVQEGEVDALVPERVWQEWSRALMENSPWRFLEILKSCGAKEKLFPEIQNLNVKKTALMKAIEQNASIELRFALQMFDLTEDDLNSLIKKYRIPNDISGLANLVNKFYQDFLSSNLNAQTILQLLEQTDAFRRPERFQQFLTTCNFLTEQLNSKSVLVWDILQELTQIDNASLVARGLKGAEFAAELRNLRLQKIDRLIER